MHCCGFLFLILGHGLLHFFLENAIAPTEQTHCAFLLQRGSICEQLTFHEHVVMSCDHCKSFCFVAH